MLKKLISLSALTLLSFNIAAAELSVVVNKSQSELTKEIVKDVYLGKNKDFTGYNLDSSDLKSQFDENVLERSSSQVKSHWSKLMFTGKGQPPEELSVTEILDEVSSDSNAIGYVPSDQVNDSVKVLFTVN